MFIFCHGSWFVLRLILNGLECKYVCVDAYAGRLHMKVCLLLYLFSTVLNATMFVLMLLLNGFEWEYVCVDAYAGWF